MSVDAASPRLFRTTYLALAVAALIAVIAVVTVSAIHHAHARHAAAVARHDRAAAYAAAKRLELPSTFAPSHASGKTVCSVAGASRLAERCWYTPEEPHQVTTALVTAAKSAGMPAILKGCGHMATKRTGALAKFAPEESCSVVATYGTYLVRLTATTNIASGTPNLPGLAPATDPAPHADGTNVVLTVVSD